MIEYSSADDAVVAVVAELLEAAAVDGERLEAVAAVGSTAGHVSAAVAVGISMSGRDMHDAVLTAATSGTMKGFKVLAGHRNHDYIDANYREELMALATQLRDL